MGEQAFVSGRVGCLRGDDDERYGSWPCGGGYERFLDSSVLDPKTGGEVGFIARMGLHDKCL